MQKLIKVLLAIWQLPQVLIALLLMIIFKDKEAFTNPDTNLTVTNINTHRAFGGSCFSLGPVIFTCKDCNLEIIKHETGHSKQSLYLGPLYLLAVAIPSVVLFITRKIGKKDKVWYHSHYPENWADKLGNVDIEKL